MTFIGWLLTVGVEGFVLGGLGILAFWILSHRSASWRHLTLTATMFGMLFVSVLAILPPIWHLPVPRVFLPVFEATENAITTVVEVVPVRSHDQLNATTKSASNAIAPSRPNRTATVEASVSQLKEIELVEATAVRTTQDSIMPAIDADRDSNADLVEEAAVPSAPRVAMSQPAICLVAAWSIGAFVTLMLPFVGLLSIQRTRRNSEKVLDARWQKLLDDLRSEMGIRRKVELRTSAVVQSAITWGLVRPTILIPTNAFQWTDGQRRIVLRHELTHILRHDWTTQMLASFCCSLHWFNPMVWWVSRQMRVEREQACDDLVLFSGVEPTRYAETLIQLAGQIRPCRSLAVIPMAHQSRLEQRMHAILDPNRRRESTSRWLNRRDLHHLRNHYAPAGARRSNQRNSSAAGRQQPGRRRVEKSR